MRPSAGLSGRDRPRDLERPQCPRSRPRASRRHCQQLVIDHKDFAVARALRGGTRCGPERGRRRDSLQCRLYAPPHGGLRGPLARPPSQHPSLAAPGLQGPPHPCAGLGVGRHHDAAAPCISSVPPWTTAPSSIRPRCRFTLATPPTPSLRASSRPSTGSIPMRFGWSPRVLCGSRETRSSKYRGQTANPPLF